MALRLMLEPFDVWLFRDGRPFTAGSDALARSRFPPTPYTVYGMLRSLLLFQAAARGAMLDLRFGEEARAVGQAVGASDDFTRLRLRGPLLAQWSGQALTRYFPAPRDLVRAAAAVAERAERCTLLAPAAETPVEATVQGGLRPLWALQAEVPESVSGWVAEDDFWGYLAGAPPVVHPSDTLYVTERRPGLGMDRQTRTAAEHLLYVVEYIRPRESVGLVVDVVEGLSEAPALLAFGGEARGTRCTALELAAGPEAPPPGLRERVAASGRVKLVLVTPALFAQGWLPAWVDPDTLETRDGQLALRLVAAAVPRPEPIGSFDLVAGKPRATQRAVPAGSVYFFEESQDGSAAAAFDHWFGQCLSDTHASIGFGLSYAGAWNEVGPAR